MFLLVLELGCRGKAPAAPPAGTQQRQAHVAGVALGEPIAGDGRGELIASSDDVGVVEIDWRSKATRTIAGARVYGPGPLWVRGDQLEWRGGAAPRPAGWTQGGAWLAPAAAGPLVTQPRGPRAALEGWRADGTRAWRVEPSLPGDRPRLVAHLGDIVLVQAVGKHDPVDGWMDGVTVALDAASGETRWRRELPASKGHPCADEAVAHGGEIALLYEDPARIEVIARADGDLLRTVRLDNTTMIIYDHVGFDGKVFWAFDYNPPHDNPGSHMLGTSPRAPSPASCHYQVWDTRHDRGRRVRATADLPADWIAGCAARAMLPLEDGGVQVVLIDGGGATSLWFDRAP